MKELVEFIVKELVDEPDELEVSCVNRGKFCDITVSVPERQMGKIIGKQGRIAKAIRSVVKAAGQKTATKYNVDIVAKN